MSYICPICNAMENDQPTCPICPGVMEDKGRLMDFFGDYSPYLEIDGTKMVDGIEDDLKHHQCPHVFVCSSCGETILKLIEEVNAS